MASLVLLAAAAAAWLLLRGGDAGEAGGNEPGRGDTPQASATLPAASLAADGPGLAPPAGNGPARTEVASAPAEQAGYELSGRLVTSGHAPLSGVEIALSALDRAAAAGLPAASLREPPAPALTGRSDADGRFRLRVRGGQESALRVRDDAWHLRGDGKDVGLDMLRVTALSADRDLGDIVLGRNARVAGRVQNEAGKTIAGVRVAVSGGRTGLLLGGIGDLVTGAEGEFASAGLKPGRYTITTASPDYLPAEVKVELQEGEHRDDLVIEVRSGHTIAGLVVDDLGTPLPGMKVTADRARELTPGVQVRSSSSGEAATTDAGGRFVLHGLETATVNVDAWGPGHARGTLANVAAGTTDLVVRLDRLAQVTGRVVDAAGTAVAGSRVTALPVASRLGMLPPGGDGVETDAGGTFLLDGVQPGTIAVVVEASDHVRIQSSPLEVRPGQRVDAGELVVQRGASLAVKVVDRAGKPVAGVKVTVTDGGTVPAAAGPGLRRAMRVRRAPSGGDVVMDGDDQVRGSALTDASGMAHIGGLAAGSAVARATHARYAPASSGPLTIPDAGRIETELTVVAGGFVQLQALDAARDALAGAQYKIQGPYAEGTEPRTETGTCDGKGLATIGPLPPGSFKVRLVMAPRAMELGAMSLMMFGGMGHEFSETETTVAVVAEQTTAVTLQRPQLALLRGTVTDGSGAVGGATVKLSERGESALPGGGYSATADGGGAFTIADLPAGKYTLQYGYQGAIAMSEMALEIAPGEALVERTLTLRTGTIRLIVTGEDGEPVARARVSLVRGGSEGAPPRRAMRMVAVMRGDGSGGPSTTSITAGDPSAVTDGAGEVEITRVPEGVYTVRIEHPQHVTGHKPEVKVLDGATADLGTVTLAAGGELRGSVLGGDGAPVPFAQVELTPLPSGEVRREPALQGSYRFTGLPAGRYRLVARLPEGAPDGGQGARSGAPIEVEIAKGERKTTDLGVK